VEDYPTNLEIATAHLKSAGYLVEIAKNGLEAVKMSQNKPYDLILMDIQMPVMDGFEATRQIRGSQSCNCHTPILAMTANAFERDRELCLTSGMNEVITKPIRRKNFLTKVNEWVKKNSHAALQMMASTEGDTSFDLSAKSPSILNKQLLINEFGDDQEILSTLINSFVRSVEKQIPLLEKNLIDMDYLAFIREVQKIKFAAANIFAEAIEKNATKIEMYLDQGNLQEVNSQLKKLKTDIELLKDFCNQD
jgi:CheY-like chemotaxis protein